MVRNWLQRLWQRMQPTLREKIKITFIPHIAKAGDTRNETGKLAVSFPAASRARLAAVKARTNAPTLQAVISDAMCTWEAITKELEAGTVFWATLSNGEHLPLEFIAHTPTTGVTQAPFGSHLTLVIDNTNETEDD